MASRFTSRLRAVSDSCPQAARVCGMVLLALMIGACGDNGTASSPTNPQTGEGLDFYDGRTLMFISPNAPGGGQDASARFLAPWLEKHLEGDVTVVVETTGGPSIPDWNEYGQRTDRDGLTIIHGAGTVHTAWRFGDPAVQYDLAEMEPLMTVPTGGVWYVSPDTGISSYEQLLDDGVQLYAAMISPTGGDGARMFMLEMLGVNVHPTFGYEGRGPSRIAFEQGEANIDTQTTTSYFDNVIDMVEAGTAIPLFSYGQLEGADLVRDPMWPELAHFGEVYEALLGEPPSGVEWDVYRMQLAIINSMSRTIWVHRDAPEEALAALRAAFVRIAEDPEFVEDAIVQYGDYPVVVDQPARDLIQANLLDVSPATIEWLADYVLETHGVELAGD